jgi:hypothetical protein
MRKANCRQSIEVKWFREAIAKNKEAKIVRSSPPGVVGGKEDTLRGSAATISGVCSLTFALA